MLVRWGWLVALLWTATAQAQGQVFALAGKRVDDPNFVAAWRGCAAEARTWGDSCLQVGRPGPARARVQDAAIAEALERGVAGLAVSVTNSRYLAESSLKAAAQRKVPVVTFDSDLDAAHRALRRVYVGPDNAELGRQLAALAAARHPRGGTLCLLAADGRDTNLAERMTGVRRGLSGDPARPEGARLDGQRGWRELPRCPWFNDDDPARALRQLGLAFGDERADVVIAVGAWPVVDVARYRAAVRDLALDDRSRARSVVVATGETSPAQQGLLRDGLVHGYVSIDFEQMGRYAYRAMKRLARDLPVDPVIRTGATVRQGL